MTTNLISTTATLATLIAFTLGCSAEQPAEVVATADGSAGAVVTSSPSSGTSNEPSPEPTVDVPQTAAIGDTVSVGNWDVRVTEVVLDADAAIAKANQFNESPAGRFVLVRYEATYTGDERIGDTFADLTWSFTTKDATVNDQASVVTPADGAPTQARAGGTVALDVAFDLAPDLVRGGTLTVEAYDDAFALVYADFTV